MLLSNVNISPKLFEDGSSNDKLLPEQNNEFPQSSPKAARHRHKLYIYAAGDLLASIILLLAAANATLLWKELQADLSCCSSLAVPLGSILHCGHSPEQARALGCAFDGIDFS